MINKLKELTITQKIFISFGIIVLTIGVYGTYSLLQMLDKENKFSSYRESAAETLLLRNISENILAARAEVLRYRLTSNPDIIAEVNQNIAAVYESEKKAEALIKDKKHRDKLTIIKKELQEYEAGFDESTSKQDTRNELVARIDALGPSIRKSLTTIMQTAFRDGDSTATYYAGRMQERLMLARLYATKFLVTNKIEDKERFDVEIKETRDYLSRLLRELQNPTRIALANKAKAEIIEYDEVFTKLVPVILERNELINVTLENLGMQIVEDVDEVYREILAYQEEAGPKNVGRNKQSH